MKADASIVKFDSNAPFSPLAGQPNGMRKNPHADYAFIYRGADTSAWGFTSNTLRKDGRAMNTIQGIQYIVNASPDHGKGPAFLSPVETAAVQAFHEALPEYARTALVPLPE